MISIYKIKPKFQELLKPILTFLFKQNITANHITWVAILLSLGTGILTWYYPYGITLILIPFLLLLRMALNALDGMMARTYNMQSKVGEVLNELGDVISDVFIFFPLIKVFPMNIYIFLGFLFLSIVNEFAGVLGKAVSGTRQYDGPMGKSDRAFLIGLICLIGYFWPDLFQYMDYIFLAAIGLLLVSTGTRIYKTIK
jgi:CDP-diacylglycerol--glycerol-3-phosphate 3-phosphatidyltransferase